jgi:hypothetical protein
MENMKNPEKYPAIIREILKLLRNSAVGKSAHFHAADRNSRLNTMMNIPVLIINLFLGSVLFFSLTQSIPTYAKWFGGILGFFGASLTIFQSFFKFNKNSLMHKRVANSYMALEREAVLQIRAYEDGVVNVNELYDKTVDLQKKYFTICEEAEELKTTKKDYAYAQKKVKNWKGIGKFTFFARDAREDEFEHKHGVKESTEKNKNNDRQDV